MQNKNKYFNYLFLGMALIGVTTAYRVYAAMEASTASSTVSATTTETSSLREQLEQQIKDRAQKLEAINSQIESAKEVLTTTKKQSSGLQKELSQIDYSINQLGLNIKSDDLSSQKLGLEISSLNYDLRDIATSISAKKEAVGRFLQELQKVEFTNTIVLFLKNDSLAESLAETRSLDTIRSQLTEDIGNLKTLQDQYNGKLSDVGQKKQDLDLHQKNLKNRKIIVEEQKGERQTLLQQTKNQESIYQKQIADLQKAQQDIANEIEALDAELRLKIDPSLLPTAASGVLGYPVQAKAALTQDYGATDFAQHGYKGKWHNGVDFGSPVGTPVFAAEDGVIAAIGDQDKYCYRGAYGKFIIINHNNNLTTLYGHLSRQIVQKGDHVTRGQVIGYVGRTGYATGAHLHFTVFAQSTYYLGPSKTCGPMPFGGDLNPLKYL